MGDQRKDGSVSTLALLGAVSALGVSLGVSFPEPSSAASAPGAAKLHAVGEKRDAQLQKCDSSQAKVESFTVKQTAASDQIKLKGHAIKLDSAQQKCHSTQIKMHEQ